MRRTSWFGAGLLLVAALTTSAAEENLPTQVALSNGKLSFRSGFNSVTISACAQFRFTADAKERFDADTDGSGVGREDGLSTSFDVPRMRLALRGGMFRPWLRYDFQAEFSRSSGEASSKVKDAVIEMEANRLAVIKMGQFKTPFSLQELTSIFRWEFVDRAITVKKFAPSRDMGVMVSGLAEDEVFGYSVGVFNGAGESKTQDDGAVMWVGRVWADPVGPYNLSESANDHPEKHVVHVGLAYRTGEAMSGTATPGIFEKPDNESAANVEVAWKYRRYFATAEYLAMLDKVANPASGPDVESRGFHAQTGVMVMPKRLELGLRYAQVDPETRHSDDEVTECRGVVGYYWQGHSLKLQGDFGWIRYDAEFGAASSLAKRGLPELGTRVGPPQAYRDRQVRVQMQLMF